MTAQFPGFWQDEAPLLLASGSSARAALLRRAGIPFDVEPSRIDERALEADGPAGPTLADRLAEAKALDVSQRSPSRLVLGADQTLACDGELLHKPADAAEATRQLRSLRGRMHELRSAAALARGGRILWSAASVASLSMRPFSDLFLSGYVEAEGARLQETVGAYRIEGAGLHLFERIVGDDPTILGLPLLPLLAALRDLGVLAA